MSQSHALKTTQPCGLEILTNQISDFTKVFTVSRTTADGRTITCLMLLRIELCKHVFLVPQQSYGYRHLLGSHTFPLCVLL